ncbi:MAG TPA: alpha/beta fold hydrolase [Micromonosporaceae bacterium]|jgi:pimeloyl-ACP methyl ester carboxylesterase
MATLTLPGTDLYYEVDGQGPPLVLVHGMGLDARMWDDQVAALRDIATVIRYDVRGYGRSLRLDDVTPYTNASDLWALLDHLGVDAAVLGGLSMGGGIALEAAVETPHRVRALVLIDAFLDGVPWDDASSDGMRAIGVGLRAGGVPAAKEAWLRHGFFAPALRRPGVAERVRQMVDDYSGVHWTADDPHGPHPDSRALLGTIAAPTTVLVGALDVPCFHDIADVLAAEIPGARKIVVPDAGHMSNMEAPAVINDALREVVQQVGG